MPRGSKPGERRGGRQRATVLTKQHFGSRRRGPPATAHELVLILAKDQGQAADTRMAIACKASLFGPVAIDAQPRGRH